jgi:molybdenum cofactor cytidylyltransferase
VASVAIVPAAGAAERFGGAKLLASLGSDVLLERTIRSLLDGGVERVVVVLGPDASDIRKGVPALDARGVRVATNRKPERGMLSSIQAGLREATGDPILVLPGDMPYVEAATVSTLLREQGRRGGILSPRFDGKRGHPVLIPGSLRDEILAAADGATLHDVLRAHASDRTDLEVYDRGVIRDVDEPKDLVEPTP